MRRARGAAVPQTRLLRSRSSSLPHRVNPALRPLLRDTAVERVMPRDRAVDAGAARSLQTSRLLNAAPALNFVDLARQVVPIGHSSLRTARGGAIVPVGQGYPLRTSAQLVRQPPPGARPAGASPGGELAIASGKALASDSPGFRAFRRPAPRRSQRGVRMSDGSCPWARSLRAAGYSPPRSSRSASV